MNRRKWSRELPLQYVLYSTLALSHHLTSPMIEYFTTRYGFPRDTAREYWTVLALLPKTLPKQIARDALGVHDQYYFWGAMLFLIRESLEAATSSWVAVANHLECLLPLGDVEKLLIQDNDFSKSKTIFWIISTIDQILPMIIDTIAQWKWFSEANNLSKGNDPHFRSQGGLPDQKKLEPIIEQVRRLDNCKTEFESLRERARSLRDGVSIEKFSLITILLILSRFSVLLV